MGTSAPKLKLGIVLPALAVLVLVGANVLRQLAPRSAPNITEVRPAIRPLDVSTDSQFVAWGANAYGQLGLGHTKQLSPFQSAVLPAAPAIRKVSLGYGYAIAESDTGKIYTWGDPRSGHLGINNRANADFGKFIQLELPTATAIAAGAEHSAVVTSDGAVYTFGLNTGGQLGIGTNNIAFTPVRVEDLPPIKSVAAGYRMTVAIDESGGLWGWGASCSDSNRRSLKMWLEKVADKLSSLDPYNNAYSVDYEGRNAQSDCVNEELIPFQTKTPVKMEGFADIVSVDVGFGHILAVTRDGAVESVGCNVFGQLGWGEKDTGPASRIPRLISSLPKISAVAAGYRHSLALSVDGTVYSWGSNAFGQLGTQNYDESSTPLKVELPRRATGIAAGHDFSLVLLDDGSVWGFGTNNFGQLGIPFKELEKSSRPLKIPNLPKARSVEAGGNLALALVAAR